MSRKPDAQRRAQAREARRDAAFWKRQSEKEQGQARQASRDQAAKRISDARKLERGK